ncbi:hypothetical protein AB0876_07405 [Mycobacterium sp. NPDC049093]
MDLPWVVRGELRMGYPGIRVDETKLAWDPAEVTVPAAPPVTAGSDPLSVLVAAVVPDYESDVKQQVAATRAREERFAANLQAARGSYHATDGAGGDQISSAGSKLSDPADAFGAGSPGSTPAAASSAGDGGGSLLSQLMGVAMQVGQQAVQVPMQAAGAAGQMVQPVMQGVQGIVQQASQGPEKPGEGAKGDAAANGAQGAGQPGSAGDKPEGKDMDDEDKSSDDRSPEDKNKDAAGADAGRGPQAPVGAPQTESSIPGEAPRHRRMTETSPEVAL